MIDAASPAIDREALERDVLPGFLGGRRWFGAKGEAGLTTRLRRAIPLPGTGGVVLGAVEAATASSAATYVVPFATDADDGIADAFEQAAFLRWTIAATADRRCIADSDGELRFERFDRFDLDADASLRWIGGEQSNSSAVLGERAVLKLLRRLAPGLHPEVEMVRHLTARGFTGVSAVLGTATWGEGGATSLVMLLQRYVPNRGDGWTWTLEELAAGRGCRAFAATLGERLAAMHAVLALPDDDPAFAPEPLDRAAAAALGERVVRQLASAAAVAPPTFDVQALAARARTIAAGAAGQRRTRIHGDLHLGQVLVTDADPVFIDFEGEPARPLAERRAKDLPLRDVAGVLRSFDYAEAKAGQADSGFRQAAERAFMTGYDRDDRLADPLLLLLLLEKAAYEITYEAANRPDWIEVPQRGLARIAGQLMRDA